jgi:hypothetical protein
LDVAEAEWSGVRRETIFARAEEVEETEIRHVGRGATKGVASEDGRPVDIVEEGEGNRFDASGWGVLFGVALVKGGQADIKLAKAV